MTGAAPHSFVLWLVEEFQTLIVGVVGFVGVICTLLVNARLARKQHERQVSHQRATLRTALCAELEQIKGLFVDACGTAKSAGEENNSAYIPDQIRVQVFKDLGHQVGLLTTREVAAVIKAYALIEELPQRIRILATQHYDSSARVVPGYVCVSSAGMDTVAKMYESFLQPIEEASGAVKENLGKG